MAAAAPPPIWTIPPCPSGLEVDLSRWPLVVLRPPARGLTDVEFRAYLDWMEKHVTTRGETYALLMDARVAPPPTPNQRRMVGDQMQRLAPFTERYCVGSAMVFDSIVMRGIMTAIFWITKPAYPTQVFASADEAAVWLQSMLRERRTALGE